ncbi:MAG: hypothetical protein IJ068_04225 [Bacilli bacterium]|nr:hypothetical protein [Bacilli bacterium]
MKENKVKLDEKDLKILKEMIDNIVNVKLVESIYLTPSYFDGEYKIGINFIINNTPNYSLKTFKEQIKDYKKEILSLKTIINELRNNLGTKDNGKIHFEFFIYDSKDFNVDAENTFEILLAKGFVSSYIVFDRYNYMQELLEILLTRVTPYDNLFEVENIIKLIEYKKR